MKLDKLDLLYGLVVIGIIILLIDLSTHGTFGFDIKMSDRMWAGMGLISIAVVGWSIGVCGKGN